MKKMYFAIAAFLISAIAFSQGTITGTVMDGETNSPLPGASVVVKGTSNGTSTDFDGNFTIEVSESTGNLVVSYIGFNSKTIAYTSTGSIATITLDPNAEELEGIVVVGTGIIDLANDRQTPIAVSTISVTEIQEKIGAQDVTMTLVNTPSVYVAGQEGGFGDSEIRVRGFEQDNTAFLLNGQPINGMEDGKMYWSNWSGMSDIANGIQIQRGLGSSKLAISSVGGTVNFVTKATDMNEGGFASAGIGNDNYLKTTIGYSTGVGEKGFGATIMLSHWQGDGYSDGTFGQGQNYFVSFGYKVNDSHNLNFLITGAPQWHDQHYTEKISEYQEYGMRYNGNWGTLGGQYLTTRRNFYHKPVSNLNWDWNINDKSSLSTVLYASWGRGGGTGGYGNGSGYIDGGTTDEGTVNWDVVKAYNSTIENGIGNASSYSGSAIRGSMNNHAWYGLVTNYKNELSDVLTMNIGADVRLYKGLHFRQLINLLGLEGFDEGNRSVQYPAGQIVSETYEAEPWSALFNKADEDERLQYDYDETINYAGVFGQLEYAKDAISFFAQGSASNQAHTRTDRWQYDVANEEGESVSNFGFNVKGGGSYAINDNNKFYANAGYYSRQPYHDNIYLNYTNEVNPLTENEKILGLEAGYTFSTSKFRARLDVYSTSWKDRVVSSSNTNDDTGLLEYTSNIGVEQLHSGIELDLMARPLDNLKFTGFLSAGNWKYVGDAVSTVRDENRNVLSTQVEDVDGGEVGGAAQFTFGLGADYEFIERLSIDANFRSYSKLYADVGAIKENIELPSYSILDLGISYKMLLGADKNKSLGLRFNVNNLLDEEYISKMTSSNAATAGDTTYKGINTNNYVYFGNGTTWNFGLRYKF